MKEEIDKSKNMGLIVFFCEFYDMDVFVWCFYEVFDWYFIERNFLMWWSDVVELKIEVEVLWKWFFDFGFGLVFFEIYVNEFFRMLIVIWFVFIDVISRLKLYDLFLLRYDSFLWMFFVERL